MWSQEQPVVGNLRPMQLTAAQGRVMALLAHGLTAKEVAFRVNRSHQTVKNHVVNAHHRLGVRCTTEAFIALGWLRPPVLPVKEP